MQRSRMKDEKVRNNMRRKNGVSRESERKDGLSEDEKIYGR